MPEKINSKNLSYSSTLPPFLARLHAQAGGATGPDPLLAAQKRSAKKRSSSEEAEDAPLVVDEDGNTVNLQVDKDGTVTDTQVQPDQDVSSDSKPDETAGKKDADPKASIGHRKRKVGKVVGESANDASDKDETDKKKIHSQKQETPADKKVKKKAKKIKLSFDEDEG
ncbi:hypothetical protein VFPPC_01211 [Pochonia chlamydosporia 170]|uniref:DUF4604 domain-containing protein n=1 Tax=Pochonia chlamydosporia 170 TaxID=1380566 RepID=A0A179G6U7_METCM|nr:hypothetical protein VFPPC_01211 [Pochonia chlamydosporia 170]OAQ73517.1 hypothetical protein VFPPC_01211 [Pochonia chlamydosporia 170]